MSSRRTREISGSDERTNHDARRRYAVRCIGWLCWRVCEQECEVMRSARSFTLVEGAVVLTILATLIGLLMPAILSAAGRGAANSVAAEQPETSLLSTVRHDGHLWVMGWSFEGGYHATHFVHHPDCPCGGTNAEKE